MGPMSRAQMGSMFFCPRARCPPKVGSPSIRLYGLLLGPTSSAHLGCQYRPHVDSPDGLRVLSARSMSAPNGQPIDPYILAPSRSHLSSPFGLPIWAPRRQPRWALCYFVRALDVRPKWASHRSVYMGSSSPFGLPIWAPRRQPRWPHVLLSAGSMSAPNGKLMNQPHL